MKRKNSATSNTQHPPLIQRNNHNKKNNNNNHNHSNDMNVTNHSDLETKEKKEESKKLASPPKTIKHTSNEHHLSPKQLNYDYISKIEKDDDKLEAFLSYIALEIENKIKENDIHEAIRLGKLQDRAESKLQALQEKKNASMRFDSTRIADIEHEISSEKTKMTFKFDLENFERVNSIFNWYIEGEKAFIAPYFPVIQSSGMGKTKLLYEYKKKRESRR
jgi:hypothetical protein